MRIAYVLNSLEGGGTTAPLPALAEVMRAHGADLHLLALEERNGRGRAQADAAGTVTVCDPPRRHLATLRWLEREIAALRPDVIWTSLTRATLLGQWVGRRLGVPVVSWQHNLYLKPANRRLLRLARGRSALWVADSAVVAAMARDRLKIDPARLETWPIFRAAMGPHASPSPDAPLRLGSLGRLHPAKGFDLLVAAMGRIEPRGVPDYRVAIAGTGELRDRLDALAAHHGVAHRLALVGHVDDSAAFLEGLDAYLQPSRREGFGIAAHEAMAAGLPLLASDTGQMAETLRASGGGMLVPTGRVDSLADALALFLKDAARWAAWGAANRDAVQRDYGPAAFADAGARVMQRVKSLVA